jgi:hypothetical protein
VLVALFACVEELIEYARGPGFEGLAEGVEVGVGGQLRRRVGYDNSSR